MSLLLLVALTAAPANYARPELLVGAETLAKEIAADSAVVVLDCRPVAEYRAGHVPGAVHVDAELWAKSVGQADDAAGWSARIAALGITKNSRVVTYDAVRSLDAARVWWILRYWGVADVRVLNGGYPAWAAADGRVSQDAVTPKPSAFVAVAQERRFANKLTVLEAVEGKTLQIVDARSEGEHCATAPKAGARAGAIPGARHLNWEDLIDPATQKFLPAPELARRMEAAGVRLDRPTVTHCHAGGRASVMAFALELMGADPARNYHPGWGEWGADATTPTAPRP